VAIDPRILCSVPGQTPDETATHSRRDEPGTAARDFFVSVAVFLAVMWPVLAILFVLFVVIPFLVHPL